MVEKLFVDHVVVPRTRALVSQCSDDHTEALEAMFEANEELHNCIDSIEDEELRWRLDKRIRAVNEAKRVYESELDKALYLGGLRDGYKLRQLLEEMDR